MVWTVRQRLILAIVVNCASCGKDFATDVPEEGPACPYCGQRWQQNNPAMEEPPRPPPARNPFYDKVKD